MKLYAVYDEDCTETGKIVYVIAEGSNEATALVEGGYFAIAINVEITGDLTPRIVDSHN